MKRLNKLYLSIFILILTLVLVACKEKPVTVTEPGDVIKMDYNVSKDNHFDSEGNLLVTYDIAFKDYFDTGEVKYDESAVLFKVPSTFDGVLSKNLKNAGLVDLIKSTDDGKVAWYKGTIKDGLVVKDVIQKLREMEDILVADYDYIYEPDVVTYEPVLENERINEQWHLNKYGIQEAWTWLENNGHEAGGSSSVVVAVIDTGVDYTHPDLALNMWENPREIPNDGIDNDNNGFVDDIHGVNVVSDNRFYTGDPMDDHGHGTHVAGIIAADNNKEGIVGIAYNTKIMAIKAGQASGYFTQSSIAAGVMYAYDNGADVINMSFGGSAISIAVQDALMAAYTRSVLVASAGNMGLPNEYVPGWMIIPSYPAALSYVVGVMSVSEMGFESIFTNWDVKGFNGVEYEVYAPGEKILSTLPNGKYAAWSGTSMAAPVVSGIAALVRSVYQDRNVYPNKFVMGQLVSTSDTHPYCLNPDMHGRHNIPMIIDAFKALTVMPKPAISLYNYYVFDTETISPENNGDGIIDAGETIDLGLILRNRWGMSKDTIVTIDAVSAGGVENPFVEFITNDINFEGVGTYSIKDTLVRDENGIITGVENPIKIKFADNTPNDYIVRINVYADYMNALDAEDLNHYALPPDTYIELVVRNGYVLPNIIDQDMTLTKDNYYIIPNSTIITKNATVTVEPGTQIQFWTNDPEDPYADVAITYLKVEGQFITQGTAEEPVRIFPSEFMSQYRVEIYERNGGYVSLNYTEVVNPYVNISYINYSKFSQNYAQPLFYRYLSEGRIFNTYGSTQIYIDLAENSVFYALGGNYYEFAYLDGHFVNNMFSENLINFTPSSFFENNVFLNNNNFRHGGSRSSTVTMGPYPKLWGMSNITYISDYDTYYFQVSYTGQSLPASVSSIQIFRNYAEYLGGSLAVFETEDEFLQYKQYSNQSGLVGLYKDPKTNELKWVNNSEVKDHVIVSNSNNDVDYLSYNGTNFSFENYVSSFIVEFKGNGYINNIQLPEFEISMDMDSSYQITPYTLQNNDDLSKIVYSTDDTGIVSVTPSGLITPISKGEATVYISAPDFINFTSIKVTVVDKVEITDFSATVKNTINKGEEQQIQTTFNPFDTTETQLIYESSDISIVTVNSNGRISGLGVGEAIITVTSPILNKSIDLPIKVVTPIVSIDFKDTIYKTTLTGQDSLALSVNPVDAQMNDITFESSNPSVAYINEQGQLVKLGYGTATIRATVENSNIYDEVTVSIQNTVENHKTINISYYDRWTFALNTDGKVYIWGKDISLPKELVYRTNPGFIKSMTTMGGNIFIINQEGKAYTYYMYDFINNGVLNDNNSYNLSILSDVKKVTTTGNTVLFLKNDGSVWGVGYNGYGEIGDGTQTSRYEPVQSLMTNVKDIANSSNMTAFLTNDNQLYIAGSQSNYTEPKWMLNNIISIDGFGIYDSITARSSTKTYLLYYHGYVYQEYNNLGQKMFLHPNRQFYINNGSVYAQGDNNYGQLGIGTNQWQSGYKKVLDVENVENIFMTYENAYFQTSDGSLYAVGNNNYRQLADFTTRNSSIAKKIVFGVSELGLALELETINIQNEQLFEESILLNFNDAVSLLGDHVYIKLLDENNTQLSITKTLKLDKLYIKPVTTLVIGETYTLTIPNNAIGTKFGVQYPQVSYTFTYIGTQEVISLENQSIQNASQINEGNHAFEFEFSYAKAGGNFNQIQIMDESNLPIESTVVLNNSILSIQTSLLQGSYQIVIPEGALQDNLNNLNEPIILSFEVIKTIQLLESSHLNLSSRHDVNELITFKFSEGIEGPQYGLIELKNSQNTSVEIQTTLVDGLLTISPLLPLIEDETYHISVPSGALMDGLNNPNLEINHIFTTYEPLTYIRNTFENQLVLPTQTLKVVFNYIESSSKYSSIRLLNSDLEMVEITTMIEDGRLLVKPVIPLEEDQVFTLEIPAGALQDEKLVTNDEITITFKSVDITPRIELTQDYVRTHHDTYFMSELGTRFINNAFLNPLSIDNTAMWFKFNATNSSDVEYMLDYAGLSGNYWSTTDRTLINKMILDFDDYQSLINIVEGTILETAPENIFPFVTKVNIYNSYGDKVTVVGNETITIEVLFNRDMETTIPLDVRFGSSLPYAEYQISGEYIDARTWRGTYTLTTLIENGNQLLNINNGHAKGNPWYKLMADVTRFGFEIDTTAAQAMIMQAIATNQGIELSWTQDDFDTLAGYNVYRSEHEDGQYQKLNNTVIPYDVKTWFDKNVVPGIIYYYNFTVVKTDLTESIPSGKVSIRSLDTMAPNLFHSPVFETYLNNNLVITASANDNVMVTEAKVFYRTTGQTTYEMIVMNAVNNKLTALIGSDKITLQGLEYYIVVTDGSNETFAGTAESPFVIVVKQTVDQNALGDVNGDGVITTLDALMVLQAINDRLNLTSEQFDRADLNANGILEAWEVLRILQYVSGKVKVII